MVKYEKNDFVEKANEVHNFRYDYSKVEYKNSYTKVCIICPKHGEFWQTPGSHLFGHGCPECNKKPIHKDFSNTKEFSVKANKVHNNKYDYSKVEYKSAREKVCIICPEHGEFWQTPNSHLRGNGCPKCKSKIKSLSIQQIKEIVKNNVGEFYDDIKEIDDNTVRLFINGYSFSILKKTLVKAKKPVTKPRVIDYEYFVTKSKSTHTINYDYSKVNLNDKKVCIICPEHGEFFVSKYNFLSGENCPKCKRSKLEDSVANFLNKNKIEYIEQYPLKNLTLNSGQVLDFFLPKHNIVIECQGSQHFSPQRWVFDDVLFEKLLSRDIKKFNTLKDAGIRTLYFIDSHIKKSKLFSDKKFCGTYNEKNSFTSLKKLLLEIESDKNIY